MKKCKKTNIYYHLRDQLILKTFSLIQELLSKKNKLINC